MIGSQLQHSSIEKDTERPEMADIEKRTVYSTTMLKLFVGLIITAMVVIFAGFVFVNARRLGWTFGWIYVVIFIAVLMINFVCLRLWNPELIERRMRFTKSTKTWDKVWAVWFAFAILAIFVVAVMEARDKVSSAPGVAWLLGLAIFILGWHLPFGPWS